jgi:hypothetical protein
VGPFHHGVARAWVVGGGDSLQIWRVVVNVLNKQLWTANKGWSFSMGVGQGANNSLSKTSLLQDVTHRL